MKTVHIVTAKNDRHDDIIFGVFSSYENARKYIEQKKDEKIIMNCKETHYTHWQYHGVPSVREWEVNGELAQYLTPQL